jgi:hypothetical protein
MMVRLDEEIAKYILGNCSGRTGDVLMDRFGISYKTFRKIEAGSLIRRSLAARLEARVGVEQAHSSVSVA